MGVDLSPRNPKNILIVDFIISIFGFGFVALAVVFQVLASLIHTIRMLMSYVFQGIALNLDWSRPYTYLAMWFGAGLWILCMGVGWFSINSPKFLPTCTKRKKISFLSGFSVFAAISVLGILVDHPATLLIISLLNVFIWIIGSQEALKIVKESWVKIQRV